MQSKETYQENEDIVLTIRLNQLLKDKNNLNWLKDNKPLSPKRYDLTENILSSNEIEYKITIRDVKIQHDDGIYELNIIEKKRNQQIEIYTGRVNVEINKKKTISLDSNWKSETNIKESENLDLNLKINKKIENINDIVLYKNKTRITDSNNKDFKITFNNSTDKNGESVCDISVKLNNAISSDSGELKLFIKELIIQKM